MVILDFFFDFFIAIIGIALMILLHTHQFLPAIGDGTWNFKKYWAANRVRLFYALAFIFLVLLALYIAPSLEVFLSQVVELKGELGTALGSFALGMFAVTTFIIGKKPEINLP